MQAVNLLALLMLQAGKCFFGLPLCNQNRSIITTDDCGCNYSLAPTEDSICIRLHSALFLWEASDGGVVTH